MQRGRPKYLRGAPSLDGRQADALDADDLVHDIDGRGVLGDAETAELDAVLERAKRAIREARRQWERGQAVRRFR